MKPCDFWGARCEKLYPVPQYIIYHGILLGWHDHLDGSYKLCFAFVCVCVFDLMTTIYKTNLYTVALVHGL